MSPFLHRHLAKSFVAILAVALFFSFSDQVVAQPQPEVAKEIFNHLVYQSRPTQSLLSRAQEHLKRQELLPALDIMQKVLDGPSDSFQWTNSLTSVRRLVREMFENMTPDGLRLYEETHGAQAQQLLKQAIADNDRALTDEVARRFFATRAGLAAFDIKASRVLDQGDVQLANSIWRDLISSNIHGSRCGQSIVLKAVTTSMMLGRDQEAKRLLEDAATRMGLPARAIAEIEAATGDVQRSISTRQVVDWTMPFGDASHSASAKGSAPYLNPAWRIPLSGDTPFAPIATWEADVGGSELDAIAVANLPLVVNGQVIFRDFTGIASCDPDTGKTLWKYSAAMSLPALWDAFETKMVGQTPESLVQITYSGNSVLGMISSDGERVFAVEFTGVENQFETTPAIRSADPIVVSNRLVALRIPSPGDANAPTIQVQRDWVAGATSGTYETGIVGGDVLKDQLFLGPPLPIDGSLYVMTESDRILSLAKLNAATGEVAWIQRVGLVEQPLYSATERKRQIGCYLPTYANGLVICPTHAGVLIAVDALHGTTQWVYYYAESQVFRGNFSTRNLADENRNPGFADPPHVVGNRLYYLPRLSSRLHCVDLETGQEVWARPRNEAVYIAVADEQQLLLISESSASCVDAVSGEPKWTKRLDIPAGRGVLLGDEYVVPLKSGTVATIHLKSGSVNTVTFVPALLQRRFERYQNADREAKNQRAADLAMYGLFESHIPSELRLGNLVAFQDKIFSLGPRYLIAYPQLDSLSGRTQQESSRDLNTVARDLAADLIKQPVGGNSSAELQRFLSRGSADDQAKSRWLLRELLLARLSQTENGLTPTQQRQVIDSIETLAQTKSEHGRVQLEQARWQLEFGSLDAAMGKLFESSAGNFSDFVNTTIKHEGVIAADVWRRDVLARASRDELPGGARLVGQRLLQDLRAVQKDGSVDAQRQFVSLYQDLPESGRVRNQLADRLILQSRVQEAELLLLENQSHPDIDVRAVAEALLIGLFTRLGLHEESGIRLHSFVAKFAQADLSALFEDGLQTNLLADSNTKPGAGFSGQNFIDRFDRRIHGWQIHQDLTPLDWQVDSVRVAKLGFADSDPNLSDSWADGRNMTNETDTELAVIRRGTFTESEWAVIDRLHGGQRGTIKMPGRFSMPIFPAYRQVGHFLPTGTMAGINGISLLELDEQAPFWSHAFPPVSGIKNPMVEPGPAFPSICIFQTRKHLLGVHPGTGRVLWRRSDLDLASGVYVDKEAGLFGDEKVLVMFHSDLRTYQLLKTQTGETIRSGQLDLEFRYHRRLFGRKLMHVTRIQSGEPQRLRIWDPLTDKFELDLPFVGRFYIDGTANNEVSIIDAEGRLRVYQMPDVKEIIDLKLGKDFMSTVVSLRTFSDAEMFYVNTQNNTAGTQQKYYFPATNSAIPFELVQQGHLMAIDRETADVKWTQPTQQKVVLKFDRLSLPFMVAVSRVRPRNSSKTQTLELEVIDRATGNILGEHPTLIPDRLVHYESDRDNGHLTLHGLQSRIKLNFSRQAQNILHDRGL